MRLASASRHRVIPLVACVALLDLSSSCDHAHFCSCFSGDTGQGGTIVIIDDDGHGRSLHACGCGHPIHEKERALARESATQIAQAAATDRGYADGLDAGSAERAERGKTVNEPLVEPPIVPEPRVDVRYPREVVEDLAARTPIWVDGFTTAYDEAYEESYREAFGRGFLDGALGAALLTSPR